MWQVLAFQHGDILKYSLSLGLNVLGGKPILAKKTKKNIMSKNSLQLNLCWNSNPEFCPLSLQEHKHYTFILSLILLHTWPGMKVKVKQHSWESFHSIFYINQISRSDFSYNFQPDGFATQRMKI